MFSEKLNYLMVVTSTTNTELSNALNINQSVISRFKLGKRKPSNNSNYYNDISKFFAHKIFKLNIQPKFSSFMNINTEKDLCNDIYEWLKMDDVPLQSNYIFSNKSNHTGYFYGDKGKQESVLLFLDSIKNRFENTLLLYSDENMNWLLDKLFSEQWRNLLITYLKNGNKIKIIHSFSRDYTELIEAILHWFPLYLSGYVEPYYIPKLRDSITRRTLFISDDKAIISNSVENKTDDMLNLFITDSQAILALKEEFNNYLSLAKPLLNYKYDSSFEQKTDFTGYIKDEIQICNMTIKVYIKNFDKFIIIKDGSLIFSSTEPNLVKAFNEYYHLYKNKLNHKSK